MPDYWSPFPTKPNFQPGDIHCVDLAPSGAIRFIIRSVVSADSDHRLLSLQPFGLRQISQLYKYLRQTLGLPSLILSQEALSPIRQPQPERRHLFAVAHEQNIAGHDRVVPGLAFDRFEARYLCELDRRCARPAPARLPQTLRCSRILIGQQQDLAVAEAAAFPLATAVLEIDARQAAAIKAKGLVFVNDEVVEVRLKAGRRPALCGSPTVRPFATARRSTPTPSPDPEPLPIRMSPSVVSAGCTMPSPSQTCFQRTVPSAGLTLITPSPFSSSTCATPAIVARCGEL